MTIIDFIFECHGGRIMDDRYLELAKRIGMGDSERIPKLFSMLADEAEADLLLALPADVPTLAEKLDRSEDETRQMIQNLFVKGMVFPSFKTDPITYRMCRDLIQFHDATILWPDAPREFLDLWQEWTEVEWPAIAKTMSEILPKPGMRIIPVGITIEAQGQILAFEDVKDIIENAKKLAVTNCTCRLIAKKCDRPVEVCLQVNNAASYALARGTGREVTREEALDIIRQSEEAGLMHATFNQKSVDHVICNCCGCCCQFMPVLIKYGTNVVDPSRFQAEIDPELCDGCEVCTERCYVDAIEMVPKEDAEENQYGLVITDKCLGCGICQVTCPTEAISLIEVRDESHVPDKFFA